MRIAIIEDLDSEFYTLCNYFERYFSSTINAFKIVHFKTGEEFLNSYKKEYDLILLDIGLPKMNGLEVAQKFRLLDSDTLLVFITNMVQFAVNGYEVDAFDFLVKPIYYSNFSLKLKRIQKKLELNQNIILTISHSNKLFHLSSSTIKYIEVSNHRMIYHTIDNNYECYGNLKDVEAKLPCNQFIRCNNCYLVNLKYVHEINGNYAIVSPDKLLISRPRKKLFLESLNNYYGGTI